MSDEGSGAFQLVVPFVQGSSSGRPSLERMADERRSGQRRRRQSDEGGRENERFDVGAIEHVNLLWQPSLPGVTDRLEESWRAKGSTWR